MRKSEWFGGILREDQPGETDGECLSRKLGLIRRYRGKDFVLPPGVKLLSRAGQLLEQGLPRTSPVIFPLHGNIVDLGSMLAGEISSYKQLPVWLRLEGSATCLAGYPSEPAANPEVDSIYMLVDEQNKIEEASTWSKALRSLLDTLDISDYVEISGYSVQEWLLPHPSGPDTFLACDSCSWKGSGDFHPLGDEALEDEPEIGSSPLLVETPGVTTIDDLCSFLQIDDRHTLKTLLLESEEGLVVQALIRGDRTVSIPKVEKLLGIQGLKPADDQTLERAGAVAGYAGPLKSEAFNPDRVVMDLTIGANVNYAAGANQTGFHLRNVRLGRDFFPDIQGDIAAAGEGDSCSFCGSSLKSVRAFRLASWKARSDLFSISGPGPERLAVGIGIGTLHILPILFSLAERGHQGGILRWPDGMEPFLVYLLSVREDEAAEEIYKVLSESGVSVFYDDRSVSPGVKFNDADLMGCPIRLTVSGRSLEAGGIEVFRIDTRTREILTLDEISRELGSRKHGYVNSA